MGDQSATRISSRGSPRRDITVGIPDVGDRNKPFEGQTDVQIESSYDAPIVEEHTDRECDDVPDDAGLQVSSGEGYQVYGGAI